MSESDEFHAYGSGPEDDDDPPFGDEDEDEDELGTMRSARSFREWGTQLHRRSHTLSSSSPSSALDVYPPSLTTAVRFMDVRDISVRWFGSDALASFGPGWWRAAQTRFLDHVEFVPAPIWATASRAWLWFAWARTYPLPIMSTHCDADEPEQFGMWRPAPSALSEYGRKYWCPADLDAYCTLWSHLWHIMRSAS